MCIFVLFQSGSTEPVEKISNLQVKQVLVKVFLKICLCMVSKKQNSSEEKNIVDKIQKKIVPTNLVDRLTLYL